MTPWLTILGIGEDGVEGLSSSARALLTAADLVMGGTRHLALAQSLIQGEHLSWPSPIEDAFPALLSRRGHRVVVLASGDPYCFGIGATLARIVPPDETLCLPAPSAFSLACARLGWALPEIATISFCGRPLTAIHPLLQPGRRILALSAGATTPAELADLLTTRGFGPTHLHVLEALGGASERIRAITADQDVPGDVAPLNLVALEIVPGQNAQVIPLTTGLPDHFFAHDGQLTKREIRAVTLSALAPRAGEILWDIGCGSGSVAIEWMLRHPANRAIAIDRHAERLARAATNAIHLGVPGLTLIAGSAPDALRDLPQPHAVFIGGGATQGGVIAAAWSNLRSGGHLVINGVTLETEAVLIETCLRLGGTLTRISVERLDRIGTLHGFRPAMTVTQWTVTKP